MIAILPSEPEWTQTHERTTDERPKAAAVVECPPLVTRGAKLQTPPKEANQPRIMLDWLRMSIPVVSLSVVRRIITSYFGEPTPGKGRFYSLDQGEHVGNAGIFYSSDPSVNHCIIEIPASALAELEPALQISLANELLWNGAKATRLDIAVDFYTEPDLIEIATTSCELGELCHARRYTPVRTVSNGQLVAHGLNIGARGNKGSGRYLRIYDKGLEQGETKPGRWVRWEVELSDDVAAASLREIVASSNVFDTAKRIAIGVCDFRLASEGKSRSLKRRPRAPWFDRFIGDIEQIRFVTDRPDATPTTFVRWMQRAVLPKMRTIATATNESLDQFALTLDPELKADPAHLGDPVVRGYLTAMEIPPHIAKSRVNMGSTP